MKVTADTNVLARALTLDDPHQAPIAIDVLRNAELVVVPMPALCELVWVLKSVYRIDAKKIAAGLRKLISADNVELNRPCAEAGLATLDAGGDFADGAIAHEGAILGADFVSFDKPAVRILLDAGIAARLLD